MQTAHPLKQDTRIAREHDGMVHIPGGTFTMGSNSHYPEEAPAHPVSVDGFWIDRQLVTNREFAAFVAATGYKTFAERPADPKDYPGALPHMLEPSSLVFLQPERPVDLRVIEGWWCYLRGADWRHPYGPKSALDGLDDHPVVHVAYCDVEAYADWIGKALPTEAEWEFAARGGLEGKEFAWGTELQPDEGYMANTWQGEFPYENFVRDGFERTSPVGSFPPNGYGLYDMIGNVWEWTADWYSISHAGVGTFCCGPTGSQGAAESDSYDPAQPQIRIPRKVLKGGSFLCAPNYCRRYRPAARHPQPVDTSTCHSGFRCVLR